MHKHKCQSRILAQKWVQILARRSVQQLLEINFSDLSVDRHCRLVNRAKTKVFPGPMDHLTLGSYYIRRPIGAKIFKLTQTFRFVICFFISLHFNAILQFKFKLLKHFKVFLEYKILVNRLNSERKAIQKLTKMNDLRTLFVYLS